MLVLSLYTEILPEKELSYEIINALYECTYIYINLKHQTHHAIKILLVSIRFIPVPQLLQ